MPGLTWLWGPPKGEAESLDRQLIKNKLALKKSDQDSSTEADSTLSSNDCKESVISVTANEIVARNAPEGLSKAKATYEGLWIELNNAMKRISGERTCRYIPKSKLNQLIDFETIKSVLELSSGSNQDCSDQYVERIMSLAPRLFAMMVLLRLPLDLLERLMKVKICDTSFPWTGPYPKSLGELDAAHFTYLIDNQWQFVAASFDNARTHEKLNANVIIPFLKRDPCGLGVFSTVSRIRLEESHQNIYCTLTSQNPDLALKVIHQYMDSTSTFENETTLLHGLGKLQDPHIVKLLYTFEQNDMYHLIFPAAECSFDVYMNQDPEGFGENDSNKSLAFTKWILSQLGGIASAIANMHEWTCAGTDSGRVAYHHDLKPSNLLLFKELDIQVPEFGLLQIADFGSGKLRASHAGTGTTTFRGTPTYAAPESIIPRMSHNGKLEIYVSRSYDVWSLGCITMEVLVWLIFGTQGRKDFAKDRFGPITSSQENDGYFCVNEEGRSEVRSQVIEWFQKLEEHPRLSQGGSLAGLLQLVVKVLEVDSSKRMTARNLSEELRCLYNLDDSQLEQHKF